MISKTFVNILQKEQIGSDGLKKSGRHDYDIALIRLDYPIADPDSGMTVLMNAKFDPETIMPICLPPHEMFRDTNRNAVAVGMGITAERYSWSLHCLLN